MQKKPTNALALYIHWPFCNSRCPYCDFNAHVREFVDQDRWRKAFEEEISHWATMTPGRNLTSIFFGGGTPSLMQPTTTAALIRAAAKKWSFASDIEITLEANPTSIEAKNFGELRAAGVNRLSLGVQALENEALNFLGRHHDRDLAIKAIKLAAKTFPRFSFDLIYARPKQSVNAWAKELREAIDLAEDHLSLYQLTIEKGTPFYIEQRAGTLIPPDDEKAAALFEVTQEICENHCLPAYEVSNHSRPGSECRHNLTYWTGGEYIGVGPGAHGRIVMNGRCYATEQVPGPENWLNATEAKGHATRHQNIINSNNRVEEIVMMGLRLTSGISRTSFFLRTGLELEDALEPRRLRPLLAAKYLVLDNGGLRVTKGGRLKLNAILEALLS
ncbi:MAG: coproporphyrinogen III oxidase [Legionellales bacterium]|nr:coproporphyrinogen III oxidase [Legionellales bacterium]